MSYYDSYCFWSDRYDTACYQINACQNRLNELAVQKQNKINEINQLKAEIKKHEEVKEKIVKIEKMDPTLLTQITGCDTKMDGTDINYTGMASCNTTAAKKVNMVYSSEISNNKSKKSQIMNDVGIKSTTVANKIIALNESLTKAQTQYTEICNSITSTNNSLASWRSTKSHAANEADYYWDLYINEDDDEDDTVVYY